MGSGAPVRTRFCIMYARLRAFLSSDLERETETAQSSAPLAREIGPHGLVAYGPGAYWPGACWRGATACAAAGSGGGPSLASR